MYHEAVAWPRTILHVDMDQFFAAIAVRDDPSLAGKAILVGGGGPRGVVSTASYEARRFGCRSAMPMATARRLCPHAELVHVPGEKIREASHRLFAIFNDFSPLVQPLSVDEAFLDATGADRLLGEGPAIAAAIKQRVCDELGLTASVGVAPNKFLAKLASEMHKPDGLTVIEPDNVQAVLDALPIGELWGVGRVTAGRLKGLGVRTVGDLRERSEGWLARQFGHEAERYWQLARGIDDRPVTPDRQAKSIGQEQTFQADLAEADEVRGVLLGQVEQVGYRLRRGGLLARGVTVKIRYGDFQTVTRSATFEHPTDATAELWTAAKALFDAWPFQPVRLIGATATRLTATRGQMSLFGGEPSARQHDLDAATDAIIAKYGQGSIRRAGPE